MDVFRNGGTFEQGNHLLFSFIELVIIMDKNMEHGIATGLVTSCSVGRRFHGARHSVIPVALIFTEFCVCVLNSKPTDFTIFFPSLLNRNGHCDRRL
jgi:hypothetical protein